MALTIIAALLLRRERDMRKYGSIFRCGRAG